LTKQYHNLNMLCLWKHIFCSVWSYLC